MRFLSKKIVMKNDWSLHIDYNKNSWIKVKWYFSIIRLNHISFAPISSSKNEMKCNQWFLWLLWNGSDYMQSYEWGKSAVRLQAGFHKISSINLFQSTTNNPATSTTFRLMIDVTSKSSKKRENFFFRPKKWINNESRLHSLIFDSWGAFISWVGGMYII